MIQHFNNISCCDFKRNLNDEQAIHHVFCIVEEKLLPGKLMAIFDVFENSQILTPVTLNYDLNCYLLNMFRHQLQKFSQSRKRVTNDVKSAASQIFRKTKIDNFQSYRSIFKT